MTGYSSSTFTLNLDDGKTIHFTVDLKTINARFFEANCKLPSLLTHLEVKIISLLQKELIRGRAYLSIRLDQEIDAFSHIQPCYRVIEEYLEIARALERNYQVPSHLSAADIFQLPHVFITEKRDLDPQHEASIMNAVSDVIQQVRTGRLREGASLQEDLMGNILTCQEKITHITRIFETMMADKKELVATLSSSLDCTASDQAAKFTLDDLYASMNKIDIHEEIVRFSNHARNFISVIENNDGDKGKQLDFILQELLREINTMMAKCSSYDISVAAVDVKVALEKCREQVQNIV